MTIILGSVYELLVGGFNSTSISYEQELGKQFAPVKVTCLPFLSMLQYKDILYQNIILTFCNITKVILTGNNFKS